MDSTPPAWRPPKARPDSFSVFMSRVDPMHVTRPSGVLSHQFFPMLDDDPARDGGSRQIRTPLTRLTRYRSLT